MSALLKLTQFANTEDSVIIINSNHIVFLEPSGFSDYNTRIIVTSGNVIQVTESITEILGQMEKITAN